MRARLGRIALGVVTYSIAALWLLGGLACASDAVEDARTPAVDLTARCDGRLSPCLDSVPGRVQGDEDGYTAFVTDAGVDYALLDSEPLPSGRRVRLEYWNSDLVAVVDMATERRYRTDEWAQGWATNEHEPIAQLAVAVVVLAPLVVGFLTALVGSLRRGPRRARRRAP